MPQVDLVEETFVVAAPDRVAAAVHDPARWADWWPDLRLGVFMDRGEAGVRWNVRGALTGSMEVWLEPYSDGVIVHHYVRCDPAGDRPLSAGAAARLRRRRQRHAKRVFWALKDELEAGRAPGESRDTA